MKNPYKKYSKINPQCEDGFRQIANPVFVALMASKLTVGEYKVVLSIMHHTWGFSKNYDLISASLIAVDTGLKIRSVRRILNLLNQKQIICIIKNGRINSTKSNINSILFNKHYDTWIVEGLREMVSKDYKQIELRLSSKTYNSDSLGSNTVSHESPIKESINKLKKDLKELSEHKIAIEYFCDLYYSRFNIKYDFCGGKDGSHIKSLLKTFGLINLKLIIDNFLNSEDEWIQDKGFTISILKTQANKFAQLISNSLPDNKVNFEKSKGIDPFLLSGKTPSQLQLESIEKQDACQKKK